MHTLAEIKGLLEVGKHVVPAHEWLARLAHKEGGV
jgi:hypothetical protein